MGQGVGNKIRVNHQQQSANQRDQGGLFFAVHEVSHTDCAEKYDEEQVGRVDLHSRILVLLIDPDRFQKIPGVTEVEVDFIFGMDK